MPKISPTEAAALNAGTVGFDGDIFTGKPELAKLLKNYDIKLSADEQSFMDNQVETLCKMINDYQIVCDRDLPENVWSYLKTQKFFGMIIPKEYGGLGFTAHGHSQIVTKLASRSGTAAVTAMVPNSLGPGELLMRYGTKEQKDFFLPRLASGEIIPCFGLTAPASGSDAASMRDEGVVMIKDGVLGVSATFKKRYITLAPVAGVVGLAFNLKDPNKLMKGVGSEGITIALLKKGHPGLRIGDRHDPLAGAFMNGTVEGENVFIPMSELLGGQERAGFGWNMLMDCLAEGRGISLPALSVAAARGVVTSVGAYSRIRKQFKVSIADMEGIQEVLASIAGNAYIMISGQFLTNAMLNHHEQPAVISAIMKQQMTSRMRTIVNNGMDILGGAGICNGPRNFLANAYTGVPIAITVEGANILTRSLIQFGQGLNRAHPHLLHLVASIQHGDHVKGFYGEVANILKHAVSNGASAFIDSFTRSRNKDNLVDHYTSQLERLSASFAFCSDVALSMGGKLKVAEFISGRFADVLSNIYLGYATLWHYSKFPRNDAKPVVDYAMMTICHDIEKAFFGIFDNFPVEGLGSLMKMTTFPTGSCYPLPSDKLTRKVATAITTVTDVRQQFAENIFIPKDLTEQTGLIHDTFAKALEVDKIYTSMRKEKRSATPKEQKLIDEVEAAREKIIQVDSFPRLGQEISMKDWTVNSRPGYTSSHK